MKQPKQPLLEPRDVEGILAFTCIVSGVSLLSIPAAMIVAGVLLVLDRITS